MKPLFLLVVLAGCADVADPEPADVADQERVPRDCDTRVPADFATIQAAVSATPDGGTVCLAAGTFAGPVVLEGRQLRILGRGPTRTTIAGSDPSSTYGVVEMDGGSVALVGLTLRGDGASSGVAAAEGDIRLQDVHVTGSDGCALVAGMGAGYTLADVRLTASGCGMAVDRAGVTGDDVAIVGNAGRGVVLYIGAVELRNSLILGNHDGGIYIGDGGSNSRFANTIIAGNTTTGNGGGASLSIWGDPSFENTVIAGNRAAEGGGVWLEGYYDTGAYADLVNTAIVGNRASVRGGGVLAAGVVDNATYAYVDLWHNRPGDYVGPAASPVGSDGNVSVDPGFVAYSGATRPSTWDLHLAPGSALIDAGDPSLVDPDGTRSDIGAYGGPDAE
jgi:hypothetical protein